MEKLKKIPITPKFYKNLPDSPGVYLYFKENKPIYIGKAINLKRRVSSYFDLHLEPKTAKMISEANFFSFIKVTSELESLLLEAKLIRKYMPQYNIAAKDDKHPLYIIITKELYPRVITARKTDLESQKNAATYGPFPSSGSVRSVLRMIRRIFPYSDHKIGKRRCIYAHIGLCNPCPSEIESTVDPTLKKEMTKKYQNNIRHVGLILDGEIARVRKNLENQMSNFSKGEDYENAINVREQIRRLEYITQPQTKVENFMENPNLYEDIRKKESSELKSILRRSDLDIGKIDHIECFDIAHLAGTNPTASMVTFINGEPDKKYYRHFRIRQQKGNSDVDSLLEVIKRRIRHIDDWGRPDLVIVDGGKPQVGVFAHELKEYGIPIVGLAKRFETLVIPNKMDGTIKLSEYKLPRGAALNLVQRLRDEAHRFARVYHHKLVSRELVSR